MRLIALPQAAEASAGNNDCMFFLLGFAPRLGDARL